MIDVPSPQRLAELFAHPPLEYGDFLTYFWESGNLTREQITWQLEQLQAQGVSGTWYYPRYVRGEPIGPNPPYWSDGWWEIFEHYVEEHERLGMTVWFSEWTGQGGWQERMREACDRNPELRGRRLRNYAVEVEGGDAAELAIPPGEAVIDASAFQCAGAALDGDTRVDLTEFIAGSRLRWPARAGRWLATVTTTQVHDLNYLRPDVARLWLEMYFTPHLDRLGRHVGKALQGYLQDELYVLDGNLMYDEVLVERFEREYGYDPRPHLAGLFHDIGAMTDKIRCAYYELMSVLLEESLYQPLGAWHEENGLKFSTIATWGRQDILGQTGHYGDFFRICRWFHIIGNEDPGSTEPGGRCFVDAKLSSSILHLYDRERAAMCVYWGSGHGMTQEQNLAWTNENFTYGLNMYNTHGGLYGSLGSWYEWVPPSVHFRQPYFELWQPFVDYVSRLSAVLSQGRHVADVALLYPLTSIHANWIGGDRFTAEAVEVNVTTLALARNIFTAGIDFDFINDDKLCEADFTGGKLRVAGMEFGMVLLPPLTTIRLATLEKLRDYVRAGGAVMGFRRLPTASTEVGRGDGQVRRLLTEIFGFASSAEYVFTAERNRHSGISMSVLEHEGGGRGIFVPEHEIHRTRYYDPGFERPACSVHEIISNQIRRDVVCSGKEVFHTHQRIGALDAYFLYNTRSERRALEFTFSVTGKVPQTWDPHTGAIRPLHRFEALDGATRVRLTMERNQGVLLVFAPDDGGCQVCSDDLAAVHEVREASDAVRLTGASDRAGSCSVEVRVGDRDYRGKARAPEPPAPVTLGGRWGFEILPTLDNRWGDFRYPASAIRQGPEARVFRYRLETAGGGMDAGWHRAAHGDADWREIWYSFAPYWYCLGPLSEEPAVLDTILRGDVDAATGGWEPYEYSQVVGHAHPEVYGVSAGAHGLDENFIYFPATDAGAVRYLLTWVCVEEAGDWNFTFGKADLGKGQFETSWRYNLGGAGVGQRAWVNGELVAEIGTGSTLVERLVPLRRGGNPVVLKLLHEPGEPVSAIAAFTHPDDAVPEVPPPPRLRWFAGDRTPVYDIAAGVSAAVRPIGWFRFEAPRGTRRMELPVDGELLGAWIDGEEALVDDEAIECEDAADEVAQVALRIRHRPGCYGAAAIPRPVLFECGPTAMPLGDWCHEALESYSGGAVYITEFTLQAHHLECEIELDLGEVKVAAEVEVNGKPVGVGLARPFTFDLIECCVAGSNRLRVRVFNTLANHYAVAFPSAYVFPGQTASGLLGPVEVRFRNRIEITALPSSAGGSA